MVATARSMKGEQGHTYRAFTGEVHAAWIKQLNRIVDLREWTKAKPDADKQAGQLARLEATLKVVVAECVRIQASVGGAFSVPVMDIQAMLATPLKGRGAVRLIKHAKAAELQVKAA